MGQALATKYRPHTFDDVTSQNSIKKILERQLSLKDFGNTYIFCGPSGCGKTTIARIFANAINNGNGAPIEIDAASNSGVDNVKALIKVASERSLVSEYKVIIMDEAHMLTNASWNAFLKCIEEPPKYTIFMFCTTDPQKIPATITNRCQRFNLTKIGAEGICERLIYICKEEGFTNYEQTCDYISRICGGGMRDAISLLEKCASYDSDLCIDNALEALGNYSYSTYFDLINFIVDQDVNNVLRIIEELDIQGNDLKLFLDKFIEFCLDVTKYILTSSIATTKIPVTLEEDIKRCSMFEGALNYYYYYIDKLMQLKCAVRNDTDIKSTIEVGLINIARGHGWSEYSSK